MRITKKQTMAAAAAGALVAVLGGTGVAMAAGNATPGPGTVTSIDAPAAPTTTVVPEAEQAGDGADQGPDANATEAGHQDANGADDATEGPESAADGAAAEGSESAADDGAEQGPDTNATEPGHQDANGADDATEGPESAADGAAE
ncbi:MAG: hypothetical protein ACYC0W_00680 [Candidatus Nanopelagicales bacterium]